MAEWLFLAYQTGFANDVPVLENSSYTGEGGRMTLVLWMTSYYMTSLNIYEWMLLSNDVSGTFMNGCVNSYATIKNIVHSLTQTLKQFVRMFILKNDMQEKGTIASNRYGWTFPDLGWLFLQYLVRASILRKHHPWNRKIPSAPVTGEIFLYSSCHHRCHGFDP